MSVVDIHTHFLPRTWPDLAARFGTPDWPWMKHLGAGKAMLMLGEQEFRPVSAACWDADMRLEAMDRDGVDVQIMCATPVLFCYQRPAAQALEVARIFNDAAREICARDPRRLKSLCQVPLQDTERACREVSRAMADGHIGVHIGNHVGAREHPRRADHHLSAALRRRGRGGVRASLGHDGTRAHAASTSCRGWWRCRRRRSCRSCG